MVGVVKHFVGRREERVLAADQVTQLERVEDRSSNSAAACPALSNSCATVIFLIRFSSGRRGLERHPACPDFLTRIGISSGMTNANGCGVGRGNWPRHRRPLRSEPQIAD